jgi:hypothetical protein
VADVLSLQILTISRKNLFVPMETRELLFLNFRMSRRNPILPLRGTSQPEGQQQTMEEARGLVGAEERIVQACE